MATNANFTIQRDNIKLSFRLLMSSGPKQRSRYPRGRRRRGVSAPRATPAQKLCGKPEAARGAPAARAGPRAAARSTRSVPGPAALARSCGGTRACRSQSRSWRRCQRCPSVRTPTGVAGPGAPLGTGGSRTAPSPAPTSGTSCSHFIPLGAWSAPALPGALSSEERSRPCPAGCARSAAGLRSAQVCPDTGAAPPLAVLSTNRPRRASSPFCGSARLCALPGCPRTASPSPSPSPIPSSSAVCPARPRGSLPRWSPASERDYASTPMPIPVPLTGTTGTPQLQGHPLPSK